MRRAVVAPRTGEYNALRQAGTRGIMRIIRIRFPSKTANLQESAMLQILIITLREGIEAFLIVAITRGILRQTGRAALLPGAVLGNGGRRRRQCHRQFLLRPGRQQAAVGGLPRRRRCGNGHLDDRLHVVYRAHDACANRRQDRAGDAEPAHPRRVVGDLRVRAADDRSRKAALETALLLTTLLAQQGDKPLLIGGLLGLTGAAALAWAWTRYGRRINLARFFQVTAIFLLIFSLQLVIYTFHEFFEAGAVPFVDNEFWHIATEPYGPEGIYGEWLTYLMVLIPAAWLAVVWFKEPPRRRWQRNTNDDVGAR